MGSLGRATAVTPVPVHGENQTSCGIGCARLLRSFGERVGYEGSSGNQCSGVLQEVAWVHVFSVFSPWPGCYVLAGTALFLRLIIATMPSRDVLRFGGRFS